MLKIICEAKTKFNTQYILDLNCEVNLHKHFLDINRTKLAYSPDTLGYKGLLLHLKL